MQNQPPPGNPTAAADSAVTAAAQAFIQRWHSVATAERASELATAQSFVIELCALLGVEPPTHEPHYQFERPITFQHGDGRTSPGRVDCYKRGHFVWESKKIKPRAPTQRGIATTTTTAATASPISTTKAFDDALLKARTQAENYARALPAAEGRPPFVVVVDVGHVIELYAEFTRSGATYTPFPDPRSLNPSRVSAKCRTPGVTHRDRAAARRLVQCPSDGRGVCPRS